MRLLHHISLPVISIEKSSSLYDAALLPLGYKRVCSGKDFAGYGIDEGNDQFAIQQVNPSVAAGPGFHLAFGAPSREAVDSFYKAAISNGATDNGKPGLRESYGPHYYAAFIIDPDGHRIEAVINEPNDI